MLQLRKIVIAIYDYQVNTPGSTINGMEENKIIEYLMKKYDASREKVQAKLKELQKENIIDDALSGNANERKLELTKKGYKLKRSWINALIFGF
ncbi:hypothetical protein IPF86_01425 [Candidatus Nomurabacteria bacterium]|nr:MAG: hypothetical protein IPF86_01425 [Candidatus Nomurabacteria bacterium]